MYIITEPYFEGGSHREVSSIKEAKDVINTLISAMRKKKSRKVQVTMTLPNEVHTTLVYYREDETLGQFKNRLIKEAKKHL